MSTGSVVDDLKLINSAYDIIRLIINPIRSSDLSREAGETSIERSKVFRLHWRLQHRGQSGVLLIWKSWVWFAPTARIFSPMYFFLLTSSPCLSLSLDSGSLKRSFFVCNTDFLIMKEITTGVNQASKRLKFSNLKKC